jgi:hypothetical protein
VDPDADITWVAIGAGTARTQALIAGSVEGAVLSSPSDVLARRAGFRELSNFAHEFRAGGAAGAAATTDFLQRRPATAGRWLEASLKGLRYMKANRAGTIQAMAPGLGVDDDVMGEVYDSVIDAFRAAGGRKRAEPLASRVSAPCLPSRSPRTWELPECAQRPAVLDCPLRRAAFGPVAPPALSASVRVDLAAPLAAD